MFFRFYERTHGYEWWGCQTTGYYVLHYCLKFLSTYIQVLHFRETMSLGFPVTNVVARNIAFKGICLFVDKQRSRKTAPPGAPAENL